VGETRWLLGWIISRIKRDVAVPAIRGSHKITVTKSLGCISRMKQLTFYAGSYTGSQFYLVPSINKGADTRGARFLKADVLASLY